MKAVTMETYFEILEKCSLQAFESLKLKNFYPKDGTKAIWDVSTLTIGTPWSRSTPEQNAITRTMYIKDNLSDTFLIALKSYCKDFETKRLVTRAYFYKKCYEALLYKVTQSELWNKPDFGFNIDLEPCTLAFIWSMRSHIQWQSEVPEINTILKNPETEISQHQQPNQRNADFDPNHFNQKSYDLFLCLVENYSKKGKVKYINIFEFMRKSIDKDKYPFKFTQEKYTAFILLNYEIEIKKYAVADGYEYDEKPFLKSHEQQFDGR
jgi:hypothetical protein